MRYRFDRLVPGVGRIRNESGATCPEEHARYNGQLTQWIAAGRLDLLEQVKSGVAVPELLSDPADRPFWPASWRLLSGLEVSPLTVKTYRKSLHALERARIVPAAMSFRGLPELPWKRIEQSWGRSGASWNQLRRCLSRVYSGVLGKGHPLRTQLLARMPLRAEPGRIPELTVEDFWRTVRLAPEAFQPYYILLAGLGLRFGEFLRLTPSDLLRDPARVVVHATKPKPRVRILPVGPELAAMLQHCIPVRHSESWIRQVWTAARKASGIGQVTLHDLRHCHGQWTLDAGVPDADVQQYLGHSTGFMTRRYRVRMAQQRNAEVISGVLFTPLLASEAGAGFVNPRPTNT